jgi:hypothetical protein
MFLIKQIIMLFDLRLISGYHIPIGPLSQMPQPMKVQRQSDAIYTAEALLATSLAFDDDPDIEEMTLYEDQEQWDTDLFTDDTAEILELSALNWMQIAEMMTGDGSRGPYNQIVKSTDFFSVCLQAPNREFRHMFWYGSPSLLCLF